ncbi:MAG: DUF5674 family protein [Thermodesulfobacteriota bacterium]
MEKILIIDSKISKDLLAKLVDRYFKDMVKYVVDVRRRVIAIGGELHADAEQLLFEKGSSQKDIWGANYYPGKGQNDCIEFTALINIRPSQGNPGMEVMDNRIRENIKQITYKLTLFRV